MGADIHMVLEKKYHDEETGEDEWVGVHAYSHLSVKAFGGISRGRTPLPEQIPGRAWPNVTERDYELFGKLASVRHDGPAPLDIPEDVSQLARVEIAGWAGDGHSHSYLSLKEFTKRYVSCEHAIGKAAADRLEGGEAFKDMETFCAGGYDVTDYDEVDTDTGVRIVFWFDN